MQRRFAAHRARAAAPHREAVGEATAPPEQRRFAALPGNRARPLQQRR